MSTLQDSDIAAGIGAKRDMRVPRNPRELRGRQDIYPSIGWTKPQRGSLQWSRRTGTKELAVPKRQGQRGAEGDQARSSLHKG